MPPKKKLCRNFQSGRCQYGEQCKFRHVAQQQQQQKPNPVGFGVQGNDFGSKQNHFKPFENKWTRNGGSQVSQQPDNQPLTANHKCTDPESCKQQVVEDFEHERPLWKLTCYGGHNKMPLTMEVDAFSASTSAAAASPIGQPPPLPLQPLLTPQSVNSEPYVVLRNEISLSTTQRLSPKTDEYFPLDVCDIADLISTPAATTMPVPELERTVEGGLFRVNCRFKSPMIQLHKETLDFCDFLSPTREEQASRNAAVECVFDVIRYIWPKCKVEVFGSFKKGFYCPTSVIDVVILGSDFITVQIGLQAFTGALSQRGIAKQIEAIAKLPVPIVKFIEKRSGVSFHISFDVQNGPKAAEFIKDAISKWPPLQPLYLILKIFLQQRELNEVYTGGIGSYALLVMLIAMMQSVREQQVSPEHNLGVLLVKFFDIYGCKFNTFDIGLSCDGAGTFFLKSNKGFLVEESPFLIAIEEPQPQALENEMGNKSFSFFQVRSAFAMALSTLTNAKIILGLGPDKSIMGTIISPDPILLERKGKVNGEMRFNHLLPAAGEPMLPHYGDQQEIYHSWRLDNEVDEPLPIRNGVVEVDNTTRSSGKKRKAFEEEKLVKVKEEMLETLSR
ncbi:unnamed protein product [Camellia sinensis]